MSENQAVPPTGERSVSNGASEAHSDAAPRTSTRRVTEASCSGADSSNSRHGNKSMLSKLSQKRSRALASISSVDRKECDNRRLQFGNQKIKPLTFISTATDWSGDQGGLTAYRILTKPWFDVVMGAIIAINSLTIGIEQHLRVHNQTGTSEYKVIEVAENIFLVLYIFELGMRFAAHGKRCLRDNWVVFDLILVVFGVLTSWILEPLGKTLGNGKTFLLLLRSGRLFRLARMVKLLVKFRVLWMLVQGLLSSMYTMLYTLIVLAIVLYLFASAAMELIRLHPDVSPDSIDNSFEELVFTKFPDLPVAMLTLVQFLMEDSVHLIYRPLILHSWHLSFYFVCVIVVVSMVLVNLVMAVIVNSAFEQAMLDRDAARHQEDVRRWRMLKELREMFEEIDEDGNGIMTREEILRMPPSELRLLEELTNETDPLDIFDALDADGSGEVTVEEFCEGIWQIANSITPLEVKKMQRQVDYITQKLRSAEFFHRALVRHVEETQQFQALVLEAYGKKGEYLSKRGSGLVTLGSDDAWPPRGGELRAHAEGSQYTVRVHDGILELGRRSSEIMEFPLEESACSPKATQPGSRFREATADEERVIAI